MQSSWERPGLMVCLALDGREMPRPPALWGRHLHQDHHHVLEQFFYAPGKGAGSFLRLHDGKRTEPGRIKLSNYRGTC